MTVTNAIAYYGNELLRAVKSNNGHQQKLHLSYNQKYDSGAKTQNLSLK
jgi:hypothetical protein